MKYVIFNKPYGVLCQFTGESGDRTLSEFNLPGGIYAAGRLDKDSEGLLFLTDDGIMNQKVTDPKSNKTKTYWVQVEKVPTQESIDTLCNGVTIKGHKTKPCHAKLIDDPNIGERIPPIRERKSIPTAWIEIKLTEGKNRQVRRMTAVIGHPTLRLIRVSIGKYQLTDLKPGEWEEIKQIDII